MVLCAQGGVSSTHHGHEERLVVHAVHEEGRHEHRRVLKDDLRDDTDRHHARQLGPLHVRVVERPAVDEPLHQQVARDDRRAPNTNQRPKRDQDY